MPIRAALRGIAGLFIAACLCAVPAQAADPQPYTVSIKGDAPGGLEDTLAQSSLLISLRENAPVGPFALVARAREDETRLRAVLESAGYYGAAVSITVNGVAISDSTLPNNLDSVANGTAVPVVVTIYRGALYHLRHIDIDGKIPEKARAVLGLEAGQAAVAADVLAAGTRVLVALQEDGYALADVAQPIALADDTEHVLDLTFQVRTGPRANIGAIALKGLKDVNERFVRSSLRIHSGDLYKPSEIESARQALAATGVFASVGASAAGALDAEGRMPVTFTFTERPMHAVSIEANYSTDLGLSLGATWSHRNLFGNAEKLNLSAAGTGLAGSATSTLGYNLKAQYIDPLFLQLDQSLEFDLQGVKQSLDAYDQQALIFAGYVRRKLSAMWNASAGFSVMQDRVNQQNTTHTYQLFAIPLSLSYDSTGLADALAEPTHGIRARLLATPTHAFPGATFAILQASGSTYFDIAGDGQSVLALRGLLGSIQGASQFDVPPDQRFYAGGSATVRGYKFQSIGPLFANSDPKGATSVVAGTIEFRQRLNEDFGAVAFIDAGQASAQSLPFTGTIRVGAGVGVRYYTSIGPVRLDVALPLKKIAGGDSFGLYIGLGQAF